jgi:hypothetical protein
LDWLKQNLSVGVETTIYSSTIAKELGSPGAEMKVWFLVDDLGEEGKIKITFRTGNGDGVNVILR